VVLKMLTFRFGPVSVTTRFVRSNGVPCGFVTLVLARCEHFEVCSVLKFDCL
jgi:hypothetical protein